MKGREEMGNEPGLRVNWGTTRALGIIIIGSIECSVDGKLFPILTCCTTVTLNSPNSNHSASSDTKPDIPF